MRTSNPALSVDTFTRLGYGSTTDTMTIQGTVFKTALLLLLTVMSAAWVWIKFVKAGGNEAVLTPWVYGGVFGGLIVAFVTIFKPIWASITAPLYALFEGFFIGGVSAMMEQAFPGIAMQATSLTFGTLFAMLAVYQSGLIRATERFKLGIVAATGGIAILYLVSLVLSLFHINLSFIYGNGTISIAFSLFVVAIAALNFVLDFDFIEQGAKKNAPKYMEWYGAFAMMVTLVWLYIEILRLLSKMRSRN